jgi:hypothetical protein
MLKYGIYELSSSDRNSILLHGNRRESCELAFQILSENEEYLLSLARLAWTEARVRDAENLSSEEGEAAVQSFLKDVTEKRREQHTAEQLRRLDDMVPEPAEFNHDSFLKLMVFPRDESQQRAVEAWVRFVDDDVSRQAYRKLTRDELDAQRRHYYEMLKVPETWRAMAREFQRWCKAQESG